MNKVDSKKKVCASPKEAISNGTRCEPFVGSECENDKLEIKSKPLNGLVNGTDGDVVHEPNTPTTKTEVALSVAAVLDSSQQQTDEISSRDDANKEALRDEKEAKPKKAKKKRNKSDNHTETNTNSHQCLLDDFDITSIIRNKYKQDVGSDERLKIVVNQFEKIELKDDRVAEEELLRIENPNIEYVAYQSELQMPLIMKIIQKDLSEPYSIYTYRYFIHNWPNLCFLAMHDDKCVGAIVCKLDMHRKVIKRGYIAMLAVDKLYRKHGLGSTLVKRAIHEMIAGDADEVVLETEITNRPALRLYEALGFVRDKRLFRYYLNGVDALRLKLWLR